jgi:hypothetical protein
MPTPILPTLLRRLPQDYQPAETAAPSIGPGIGTSAPLYTRHEGGLLSRALGTAVHALLEDLARLRETQDRDAAREALQRFEPRVAAQARAVGVNPDQASQLAARALQITLDASREPIGAWILSPHSNAASETNWTSVASGGLRTVRVDRVFRAGSTPGSVSPEEEACWWIIDYKTAHEDGVDPAKALPAFHALFAPQVEAYTEILRNLHGEGTLIRAGLYYPRMLLLDWWKA